MKILLSESQLKRILNENRVVTFNGRTYPRNGWCVVLSGGSGSGKGFVVNNSLPIDGKIIDVDKYKEFFVKMNNNRVEGDNGEEIYDPKNPDHVSYVHQQVKKRRWKEKRRADILNPETHRADMLPNIIFDITGKKPNKSVIEIVEESKKVGYNNILVWVVSNRSESIIRNIQRPRRVPDEILHDIHNNLMVDMLPFLNNSKAINYIDEAWIVFGSTESIKQPEFTDDEKKNIAIRLNKTENGFEMDEDTENRVHRYLGKFETNVKNPEVYMPSDDVISKFGEKQTNVQTKPNWLDLTNPRTKTRTYYKINRSKLPPDLMKR